jgi:subtilase family serine protease
LVIANTSDPHLEAAIADKIAYVGGLTTHQKTPYFTRQRDLDTGKTIEAQSFPPNGKTGMYETNCFRGVETHAFAYAPAPVASPSPGVSPAPSPSSGPVQASYTGNRYGSDANAVTPALPPCGYSPAVIRQVYGITDLAHLGLDGSGQTIVIIDAFGSPTIQADIQAFSTASGLPPADLTVYAPGGPTVSGPWNPLQQGWAGETTLDVEWAHVIAPGAKIALVEAASPSDDDLAAAFAYALDNHLGNVVSNSWGGPESQEDSASVALWDVLLKTATAQGVAVMFSSGDSGDSVNGEGGDGLGYIDVSSPTDSQYVTAIGGVSLALNADQSIKFQVGWGTNGVRITDGVDDVSKSVSNQNAPLDPPSKIGFIGGSGGGTSRTIAKPAYQGALPGANRMLPDISFLADPYTGVEVIETAFDANGNPLPGNLTISVIGGTSLSSPMFSGLWAVADQAHGSSLGQAAPLLYAVPSNSNAITDIVPLGSSTDVTGTLTDTTGTALINALSLALPETITPFYSAIYNSPTSPFRWDVITFGTDSTLETAPGWDNVTGLGVPNGVAFVQQFMGGH